MPRRAQIARNQRNRVRQNLPAAQAADDNQNAEHEGNESGDEISQSAVLDEKMELKSVLSLKLRNNNA